MLLAFACYYKTVKLEIGGVGKLFFFIIGRSTLKASKKHTQLLEDYKLENRGENQSF